jgi:phospholipase C
MMYLRRFCVKRWPVCAAIWVTFQLSSMLMAADGDRNTATPIKHVIVIIGENRSFDHVFATYVPRKGQTVSNLLSKGIVNANGTAGPNFSMAAQYETKDASPGPFQLSPTPKKLFQLLPPPNTGGAPQYPSNTSPAPFLTIDLASSVEPGLLQPDIYELLTGATGLPNDSLDMRILHYNSLPSGPFQLTPSVGYDSYADSPVHRFYQMWQQLDCNVIYATKSNPSGCLSDLYPWVEITISSGSNGNPPPSPFTWETTNEGATSMEYYNVQNGDAPYLKMLADQYNWYTQDGYSGGTYTNCSDPSQPGGAPILSYLQSLPYTPRSRCAANSYYLLNNYSPGYYGDGSVNTNEFVIPPSSLRNIGDELLEHGISWKYYGENWNRYLNDPTFSNPYNRYCDICNPFQYSTSIMTNAAVRTEHLVDVVGPNGLYSDLQSGGLPAVSIVKPDGFLDGHPSSSKPDLFEGFVQKILVELQSNAALAATTAVFITVDEAGGYYDSGYVQPLDYFGDGPRIPIIVVSPYSTGGRVVHTYYDHVSILKFIEKNWGLPPVTTRSRDNFPNPIADPVNPYVPVNSPAIGDLMEMFDFGPQP